MIITFYALFFFFVRSFPLASRFVNAQSFTQRYSDCVLFFLFFFFVALIRRNKKQKQQKGMNMGLPGRRCGASKGHDSC